ncbi:uncharacterized protein K460DRAFT_133080 [Cucurbitaria berberidis CBS 394.84]|uniref:Uncharacterized protein n=1 Tax=Cucurbitaria berberidis CBS 394.84 TaxID=1168544 RepID=A0A9P4GBB8_9PLEO|nr:uncharacterized protein K460DRAFT_133080 [Cucurbitaria berberidis CBS 394.84]KAF1842683.1 hypothetical protein K460DRAFT_133080 [Cucurbitaria berberidis CBS 394.84]
MAFQTPCRHFHSSYMLGAGALLDTHDCLFPFLLQFDDSIGLLWAANTALSWHGMMGMRIKACSSLYILNDNLDNGAETTFRCPGRWSAANVMLWSKSELCIHGLCVDRRHKAKLASQPRYACTLRSRGTVSRRRAVTYLGIPFGGAATYKPSLPAHARALNPSTGRATSLVTLIYQHQPWTWCLLLPILATTPRPHHGV